MTVTDQAKAGFGGLPSLPEVNLLTINSEQNPHGAAASAGGPEQHARRQEQAAILEQNGGATRWLPELHVGASLQLAALGADAPQGDRRQEGQLQDAPLEETIGKCDLKSAKKIELDKDGHVVTDGTGKPKTSDVPASGLSSGRHMIEMSDGRRFVITLPDGFRDGKYYQDGKEAPLPVLFVMHGTLTAPGRGNRASLTINPEDFIRETNFTGEAPDGKYATVQPLAQLHTNGPGTSPCFSWVAPDGGALMSNRVAKQAVDGNGNKIDDYAYMDSVASAVEQLIKSNPQDEHRHDNWSAFGFSQGGPFLLKYMSHKANIFPSAAFEATAISEGPEHYQTKAGNLKNVVLVNNGGDNLVMTRNWAARAAGSLIGFDEMGAADPKALEALLIKGQTLESHEKAVKLSPTDDQPNPEVGVRTYKADDRSTMVIDLWKAQHSVAGEGPGGGVLGTKYNDHNFSQKQIIGRWLQKLGTPKRNLGS